jgi:predicted RND superfamily exporter protein
MGALARLGHRRPWQALLLVTLVAALAGISASRVRLDADLSGLLPKSFASIRGLEQLQKRFGGIGYVVVVGQGEDLQGLRRFADDAALRLAALPEVRWVDHKRSGEFLKDRALYFLDTADLEEVHKRLQARYKYEKRKANPLYVKLDDEPVPPLDFGDIEARVAGGSQKRLSGDGEPYYLEPNAGKTADGKTFARIVVMAKPARTSVDLAYAAQLLRKAEAEVAALDPQRYGPGFRADLTGTFKKKVDQQGQIAADIASTSLLALALVLAYLFWHFRSVAAVALVLGPTSAGLICTYGFVGLAYGSVNLLTGFLGAILGGLGTEHGIHLVGRYAALRREGKNSEDATAEAFSHTGASALVAAVVAALTFASLAISEFRAFREFGVIAAFGMIAVLLAYLSMLPALFAIWHRLAPLRPLAPELPQARAVLAHWLPRAAKPLIATGIAALLALGWMGREVRFDYDFAALEDGSLPSFRLDRDVNRILGYSQTPVVLLTERPEDERAVVAELNNRKAKLGAASTVDFVGALDDLVPRDQAAKREILDRIGKITDRIEAAKLDPADRPRFADLRRAVAAPPFGRDDLPPEIRRQFEGLGSEKAGFVLVFPRVSLADGEKVRALAREVRTIELANDRSVSAAGDAMVLADILEMVTRESPWVLLAALVSVLLTTWALMGSLGLALVCIAPTVLSLLALIGAMPLLGWPFNYLNILVVPVLVGTTVDGAVHLVSRLRSQEEPFAQAYSETSRAVAGGLLTSAVGFGALLLADHPGLQSIGKLAVLGFTINLVFMLLLLPAGLWLARRVSKPEDVGVLS